MRTLKASLVYFVSVFGVGFILGAIRVPFLVPRLGMRTAELLELPIMVAVSYFFARMAVRRFGPFSPRQGMVVGTSALAFLIAAELGLVLVLQGQSLGQYVASRDPVSGAAYLVSLALFWFMPLLAGHWQGPTISSSRSRSRSRVPARPDSAFGGKER